MTAWVQAAVVSYVGVVAEAARQWSATQTGAESSAKEAIASAYAAAVPAIAAAAAAQAAHTQASVRTQLAGRVASAGTQLVSARGAAGRQLAGQMAGAYAAAQRGGGAADVTRVAALDGAAGRFAGRFSAAQAQCESTLLSVALQFGIQALTLNVAGLAAAGIDYFRPEAGRLLGTQWIENAIHGFVGHITRYFWHYVQVGVSVVGIVAAVAFPGPGWVVGLLLIGGQMLYNGYRRSQDASLSWMQVLVGAVSDTVCVTKFAGVFTNYDIVTGRYLNLTWGERLLWFGEGVLQAVAVGTTLRGAVTWLRGSPAASAPPQASAPKVTAHGAERLADASRTLSEAEIAAARTAHILEQADGARVFIQQVGPDKFNVFVEGSQGIITTFRHISPGAVKRLAINYGWRAP